ncbi:MAG: glycosyltransferase [Pseudomonadota bacterium]
MPLRVVHVISNLGTGGAETMLVRLLAADRKRHEHAVISFLSDGALAPDVRGLGVDLFEMGAKRSAGTALLLPGLARLLTRLQPDVVQGWMYHANVAASASRFFMRSRPPVLWNIRQTLQKLSNNSLLTQGTILAGTLLRASPAGIVYNSTESAIQHERLGYPQTKRIIIENGFDLAAFQPREAARKNLMKALGLEGTPVLIGRVARKAVQKDDPTLFAAFAEIAAQHKDAQLVLIGPGMDRTDPELDRLARDTLACERIHFLGPRRDITDLTAGFDIAVSSSAHSEGFSNVIAEAMAAGVPVVATDVGEARRIVEDDSRIAPPGRPDALAAAIVRILALSDSDRHILGQSDRNRIEKSFGIETIAARYGALWQKTAGRAGSSAPEGSQDG